MSILMGTFADDIKKTVIEYTGKLTRRELVTSLFKASVAKVLEVYMVKEETTRLEFDLMTECKREMITAFMGAEIDNGQHSLPEYETMFDNAIKEIVQGAMSDQEERVDFAGQAYRSNDGGIYLPPSMQ